MITSCHACTEPFIAIVRVSSTRSSGIAVTVMTASRAPVGSRAARGFALRSHADNANMTVKPSATATRSRRRDAWGGMSSSSLISISLLI